MSGRLHLPVILFFAALLALGLAIHRDYGISWDEPFQRFTGAVTVKHLAEKFAPSLVSGEAARLPALADYIDRDHGTAFEAPAVALEALLGLTDKRDIFMLRHLLTFLVCFAGAIALYGLAARRFSDWRLGLLAALLLALSPRLFAESLYNSKDAVFMAAFAIALNTAVAFVLSPGIRTALLHAVATGFAIDIRIMAVILPAASIAILALRLVRGELPVQRTVVAGAVYLVAAFAAAVAMWVWLWADPVGNFLEAFARWRSSATPATRSTWGTISWAPSCPGTTSPSGSRSRRRPSTWRFSSSARQPSSGAWRRAAGACGGATRNCRICSSSDWSSCRCWR